MANQIDRRIMVSWLLDHGFREIRRASSLRKFSREGCGWIFVGSQATVEKKYVSNFLHRLAAMGFNVDEVRTELQTRSWKHCTADSHRVASPHRG